MPSSDTIADPDRPQVGFILWFAGTLVLTIAALILFAFLYDARGLVVRQWPGAPSLCSSVGVRADARESRQYLSYLTPPREIMLGNSRTVEGFYAGDVNRLLTKPTLNLGVGAGSIDDISRLAEGAIAQGTVRRVWIGIDYLMMASEPRPATDLRMPRDRWRPLFALYYGVVSPDAILSALSAVRYRGGCARFAPDLNGFSTLDPDLGRIGAKRATFDPMKAVVLRVANDRAQRILNYARQREQLGRLIERLQARHIKVVLFLGPISNATFSALSKSGLSPDYMRWRRDMASIAANTGSGLDFVDLSAPGVVKETPQCDATWSSWCPFYDSLHFGPMVGRRILLLGTHRRAVSE